MEAKLKETKILVNSILMASENALSLGQLEADYKMMENEYIPFKEFGFKSLLEFLQSCSDIVRIIHVGGTAQLLPVVGDESKHIRDLVQNQKKDPSKKVNSKIPYSVEENILRLLGRVPGHKLPVNRLNSMYARSYGTSIPSPRGKLAAWLGTSNRFAILTLEKNNKIIEPLSIVDMTRYAPKKGLSDKSMSELRSSVLSALSYKPASAQPRSGSGQPFAPSNTWNASNRQVYSTPSFGYTPPVPYVANGFGTQRTSAAPTLNVSAQTYVPQSTATYGTSWTSHVPQPASQNQSPAPVPVRTTFSAVHVPQPPAASTTGPAGLTPEIRQLLLKFMMKNPESTSVPALHKGYEYHHGPIDINLFLSWLISMPECLVIGAAKGRVYLRPESRLPTAIPEPAAVPASQPAPAAPPAPVVAPAPVVPPVLNGHIQHEPLKITVQTTNDAGGPTTNGWQRVVETYQPPSQQGVVNGAEDFDRALEGISGLTVTDIIDFVEMMRRKARVPLDQILGDFEDTFQRTIEPNDGAEGLVESLCRLGLLKLAPNSDVSLAAPACLKTFDYEPGQWLDVSEDDAFWNKFISDGILTEGISVTGKVVCNTETGFTFSPNWCPPDDLYARAPITAGGDYIYSNGNGKFRAVAHSSISMSGHWLISLPDLGKFRPCRREHLFVGPPQPIFDVIPIGRCPAVGEEVKLKIVQVSSEMTFACIDHEEPCCTLKSKVDPNFTFRVLHWDNQRFIPREDLAKLSLDRGLTSMDSSAIAQGEYFAAGGWMRDIQDPFFIPMIELVELLETTGFREDAVHDLLLI